GQGPGLKGIVPARRPVGIRRIVPVGHFAVRSAFDVLHDSGIYSFDYLYRLGAEREARWAEYERALAAKGLSRDPPARRT
ncbi:MAG: gamma-butyrobetaine hydroxylase-like domain-containing protein, partial [Acetobacteraceae bacterium]